MLVLTRFDIYAIMDLQEYTNNGWRRILDSRKGVILMSWNDFFQLLIAVSNILLAIKAFSNDDNKRK